MTIPDQLAQDYVSLLQEAQRRVRASALPVSCPHILKGNHDNLPSESRVSTPGLDRRAGVHRDRM